VQIEVFMCGMTLVHAHILGRPVWKCRLCFIVAVTILMVQARQATLCTCAPWTCSFMPHSARNAGFCVSGVHTHWVAHGCSSAPGLI